MGQKIVALLLIGSAIALHYDRKVFWEHADAQAFQSQHGGTEWNLLMAASVMVILPIVLLFFMSQRTFIQGIATTGIKG